MRSRTGHNRNLLVSGLVKHNFLHHKVAEVCADQLVVERWVASRINAQIACGHLKRRVEVRGASLSSLNDAIAGEENNDAQDRENYPGAHLHYCPRWSVIQSGRMVRAMS